MRLFNTYIKRFGDFRTGSSSRYLSHKQLIERLSVLDHFIERWSIGNSHENRPIQVFRLGSGETKVLSWTQMHGNEPTATWAIIDLLAFLQTILNEKEREEFLNSISWYCIPMLNPDGSVAFIRENAQGIDLNRDYLDEKAMETKVLKSQLQEINPDLCLNLHDQRSIFTTSSNKLPALISFLSPSFNQERSVNPMRRKGMDLIGRLADLVEIQYPGMVGRYTDEFYPTAFGDNLVKAGHSTILIESGSGVNDPQRLISRKLTGATILECLLRPSENHGRTDRYWNIPENLKGARDMVFRNCHSKDGLIDLAFQSTEVVDHEGNLSLRWTCDAIGPKLQLNGWKERNFLGKRRAPSIEEGEILQPALVDELELG